MRWRELFLFLMNHKDLTSIGCDHPSHLTLEESGPQFTFIRHPLKIKSSISYHWMKENVSLCFHWYGIVMEFLTYHQQQLIICVSMCELSSFVFIWAHIINWFLAYRTGSQLETITGQLLANPSNTNCDCSSG